ncbi:MAG: hypothetical protein ABL962_05380 [Fimbriimonadaceae bacterium]
MAASPVCMVCCCNDDLVFMWLLYSLNRESHTDEEGVAHIWFEQQVG